MKALTIRRPVLEDQDALYELFYQVMSHTFIKNDLFHLKALFDSEIVGKKNYLQMDFDSKGKQRYFLIGELDGRIVACIEHGPPNEDMVKGSDGAILGLQEVGTVYVHPDYQRQGIGNTMLQAIYKVLKDKSYDRFGLDSGFVSAQKIWSRRFGEPTYFLKDFWGPDAHHMIWVVDLDRVLEVS